MSEKALVAECIDFEGIYAVNSGSRSIPLIIYFPNKEELEKGNSSVTTGKRVLQGAGIAYTDLTPCLLLFFLQTWRMKPLPLKRISLQA